MIQIHKRFIYDLYIICIHKEFIDESYMIYIHIGIINDLHSYRFIILFILIYDTYSYWIHKWLTLMEVL
jgi:hypothetical protein